MHDHSTETIDHLTDVGVRAIESASQDSTVDNLDASRLTVEVTKEPRNVPENNSDEVWRMRTCSDHSMSDVLSQAVNLSLNHNYVVFLTAGSSS
jgi:hypothetical protein